MNQDYSVLADIVYNLSDAHEELTEIIELIQPGVEIDEIDFKYRMAHLYYHLNMAWNMRNVSLEELNLASGEQRRIWGRYPTDLEPFP